MSDYNKYMRTTTLNDITMTVVQEAYAIALQAICNENARIFLQPMTMQCMVNDICNDKHVRDVQKVLKAQFRSKFVHPHPFNEVARNSELLVMPPIDGMAFDSRFMVPMLLVARWFARVCIRDPDTISNNHAHLVLYGSTGTGKSLLTSIIAKNIPTYKYMVGGRF